MIFAMSLGPGSLAEVAALLGDPARAHMLDALMDGRALTATELALAARVAPSTASAHLAKLEDARLLTLLKQGRHRYYRLASPLIGRMLESVMAVAAVQSPARHRPPTPRDAALGLVRTCYDHLAGRLAVGIADALQQRGYLALEDEAGALTEAGARFLQKFGLDLDLEQKRRRSFCRPCLDWTERRMHIGGAVGAGLARRCLELGWLERRRDSRALKVTPLGLEGFRHNFDLDASLPGAGAKPAAKGVAGR